MIYTIGQTIRKRQIELLLVAIVFLVCLALGAYMSTVGKYLPKDALSRLVSAYLVFNGTEMKMASIGFVWPPIPTLLLLPFVLVPYLVKTWMALVIVSSICMAIAVGLVYRIAELCGLPLIWRVVTSILFAINPMIFIFGSNGMSEAILIAASLAAFYWLLRFVQKGRSLDLVISGLFFGALPLIRYEMMLLTIGGLVLLAVNSWSKRDELSSTNFRNLLEGRLLAFGTLAVYPIFLWMFANWQIMGNPIYFINNERGALTVSTVEIIDTGLNTAWPAAIQFIFETWTLLFPLALVAVVIAIIVGIMRKSPFLVTFALVSLLIPGSLTFLFQRQSTIPLLRYFIMEVPLAVVLSLETIRIFLRLGSSVPEKNKLRSTLILLLFSVVFLGASFSTGYELKVFKITRDENLIWSALTTGEPFNSPHFEQINAQFDGSYQVGKALNDIIPAGSRVLLDTYGGGYAVVLGSENHSIFLDFTDPHYLDAVIRPWNYADYVLIPRPEREGQLNQLIRTHPLLYSGDVSWAELVIDERFPETRYGWRLFKIKR
jgi:hypothetical protein